MDSLSSDPARRKLYYDAGLAASPKKLSSQTGEGLTLARKGQWDGFGSLDIFGGVSEWRKNFRGADPSDS